MIPLLTEFAPVFYGITTWYKVEVLVVGAILATGKRTGSAVRRVMGLQEARNYASYHHVLLRLLTILAPSERYYETPIRQHKRLTDGARQAIYQVRRWLPDRRLSFVGDSTYAALE